MESDDASVKVTKFPKCFLVKGTFCENVGTTFYNILRCC